MTVPEAMASRVGLRYTQTFYHFVAESMLELDEKTIYQLLIQLKAHPDNSTEYGAPVPISMWRMSWLKHPLKSL